MGVIVWSTIAGSTVHEGDEGLPIYRQRILLGRMYSSRSYAPRWQVWLISPGPLHSFYAPKTKRVPTAEWITLSGNSARTRS